MKKQPTISNPYYLRMRFKKPDGQWGEWVNRGMGEFTDLQTAQRSIRILSAIDTSVDRQVEFKHENSLKDYDGKITGEPITYKKNERRYT